MGNIVKPASFKRKYILSHELGRGAFSIVRLAVAKESQKHFAVKIIQKKKMDESDVEDLLSEIYILGQLSHPHIIGLIEMFDEKSDYYVVTELVRGGELFNRIVSKKSYTEKGARDLIKSFIETIAYIHSKGVVHRDLKPENLLLTSETDDIDIKIADFGFAKRICDLKDNEPPCGTPGYVAPEILRRDRYGAEVDIWSMGIICYVLLAGYPPFYDDNQARLFAKIKEAEFEFHEQQWKHVSREAKDLISKMICLDQQERWTATQLLEHPWIAAKDDELENRDLTPSITEMKRFNAKRKFRAAASAVVLSNRLSRVAKIVP